MVTAKDHGSEKKKNTETELNTLADKNSELNVITSIVVGTQSNVFEILVNLMKRVESLQSEGNLWSNGTPSPRGVHVRDIPVGTKAAAQSAASVPSSPP